MPDSFQDTDDAVLQEQLKAPGPWRSPRQEFTSPDAWLKAPVKGEWVGWAPQGQEFVTLAAFCCPQCGKIHKRHIGSDLTQPATDDDIPIAFQCSCGLAKPVVLLLVEFPLVGFSRPPVWFLDGSHEGRVMWTYRGNGNWERGPWQADNLPEFQFPEPPPAYSDASDTDMSRLNGWPHSGIGWHEMGETVVDAASQVPEAPGMK